MNEDIKRMLDLMWEEQIRAKQFCNDNGFDCTTAPYAIVNEYRNNIKRHCELLRYNLEIKNG